jgi:integrase
VIPSSSAISETARLPTHGARPIDEIGPADAKALLRAMREKGLADDTIRAALVPFRGIVADWAEDAKRPNPIAGPRLFGKKNAGGRGRRKIAPPDAAAVTEVVAAARDDAKDAILVATATGLRRGELFGLRWRDVDFDENVIRVTAYNFGGKVEDGRFKTEAGERDVPLFKSIRKVLLERKAREEHCGPDDFVFGTSIGTPLDPNNSSSESSSRPSRRRTRSGRRRSSSRSLRSAGTTSATTPYPP